MFNELFNWLAMIELPVFAALFRMIAKQRREMEEYLLESQNHTDGRVDLCKDVENRLTNHLLRIEKKLDDVGRGK